MNAAGVTTRRLFVAVPLPVELEPFALRAQQLLPAGPGVRLLGSEQLHVTLAFIGETDAPRAEVAGAIVETLAAENGGQAAIDGFLLMPSARRSRLIALAVDDVSGVFARLFEAVVGRLEAAGMMRREKRSFRAHVTIARVSKPGGVQPMSDCGRAPFRVESVCLYESKLRRDGASYTVLARSDLNRADGQETA